MTGRVQTTVNRTSLEALADLVGHGSDAASTTRISGTVIELAADSCLVSGLSKFAQIDDIVEFDTPEKALLGQIVRIGVGAVTIKPLSSFQSVRIGTKVAYRGGLSLRPHLAWKGRILNAFGEPVDGKGPLPIGERRMQLDNDPPHALERQRVSKPLQTGIKVIDVFTPLCRGQRVGVFAGSGLGKSTLLRMLAAAPDFDTVVVALVGERGREVREFLEDGLGPIAERTISVISTSDESSMMRRLAPSTAVCMAEFFRDEGDSVLLIVDSITRFAHAARDAAMAAGEPPIARGYSPSVFSDLVRLLERTGPGRDNSSGSITGVFSVLVDGDDHDEPIADTIRGTLDGHIVLDRAIAQQGRYPAVDPLRSLSRLAPHIWSSDQQRLVMSLRAMIARYEDGRDMRMLSGQQNGVDPLTDQAVELIPRLYEILEQAPEDPLSDDPFRDIATAFAAQINENPVPQ
ncbi:MAG: FliI/YscN family ATPase [Hyphomicrobiaceae bacterium]